MTIQEQHQREKKKEQLIAMLKTLAGLANDEQWETFNLRWRNCEQAVEELIHIGREADTFRASLGLS